MRRSPRPAISRISPWLAVARGECLLEHVGELWCAASVWVGGGVVDRYLQAEGRGVLDEGAQQLRCLGEAEPAGQGRVDGGHEAGVEHVDVEVNPKARADRRDPAEGLPGDT